jgi:catechol 2,3-dioxygenase-like lactoylglutathione lyase family enzyme
MEKDMGFIAIDHVQLAMPQGEEDTARAFYGGVLGMSESPKPPVLAARGGVWFEAGAVKVHLGVEQEFRAARKAHPAFLVDNLDALVACCHAAGYAVTGDEPIAGYRRVHVSDPFGNRIELMEFQGVESVRTKLQRLGISEQDLVDAVQWARSKEDPQS